jgi:hypothetical protein
MTIRCYRYLVRCAVLILLIFQVGCVASQAPKVQCDSNLRPINSSHSDKP